MPYLYSQGSKRGSSNEVNGGGGAIDIRRLMAPCIIVNITAISLYDVINTQVNTLSVLFTLISNKMMHFHAAKFNIL